MDLITYALLNKKILNVKDTIDNLTIQATELPEAIGGVSTLEINTEYYLGTQTELNLAFDSGAEAGDWCFICFVAGTNATVDLDNNCVGDTDIELETGKTYEILATYNSTNWLVSYLCY